MQVASDFSVQKSSVTGAMAQFLVFKLGQEEYGVDLLKVQEIRGYESPARIAGASDHMKGVVNLRGTIVPVIDMRIKMNLDNPTYDEFTVVIVLNIGIRIIGMVVDSVSDVMSLNSEQIKPAPEVGTSLGSDYLLGIGTIDDRMLILLDIEELMTSEDMGLIEIAIA